MKLGSLCSGYGGLDLAIESIFNVELAWYSEYDKNPSKIMEKNYPGITNHKDLTQIKWEQIEQVDILSAGYPCQPFSMAGQRKGTDDPRHLWPYIADAIRILRPGLVVLENVRGHLSLGFDHVLQDLATIGYAAQWQIVRASDIGAPHQRSRLFVIAYPNGAGGKNQLCPTKPNFNLESSFESFTHSINWESIGYLQKSRGGSIPRIDMRMPTIGQAWGRYQDAIRNWERLTRPCPEPITDGRLEPRFVEWMMGLPAGWVTESGLSRTAELKALGNGVVPQQAAYAISRLLNR